VQRGLKQEQVHSLIQSEGKAKVHLPDRKMGKLKRELHWVFQDLTLLLGYAGLG
jgi:hypothetical protein